MKKYFSYIFVFIVGVVFTVLAMQLRNELALKSFQESSDRVLKFDPYEYAKRSKSATTYFYHGLPDIIQKDLAKHPDLEFITSCEADLIPGGKAEFAVSAFSGNKARLFIYELEDEDKIKDVVDVSSALQFEKKDAREYLELHCRHSAYILNNSKFQLNPKATELVGELAAQNAEIIELRARHSENFGVFTLIDGKLIQLGILPGEL